MTNKPAGSPESAYEYARWLYWAAARKIPYKTAVGMWIDYIWADPSIREDIIGTDLREFLNHELTKEAED